MYAGMGHVFRTKTQGVGARTLAAFRANCNEFASVGAGNLLEVLKRRDIVTLVVT